MSSASSGPCDNPDAGSDSDIMSEVVRVMSSELKRARVEQDRLCEEKERLQQELNDAHTQLCVMKKAQEQQSERLGGDSNAKRYEKALRKIDRLEKSLEEMTEKLTKVQDKYKNSKASLREARTELDRLRAATAVDVSKVPETGESHSLKRKARTEDGETPARLDSRHVTELPMPAEKQLQTLTVSYEKDLANIRQFLVISPGETLKEPSLQHCQMLRGKQNWEALITYIHSKKLRSVHMEYVGRNSTVSTFFVQCAGNGSVPGQPVANLTRNAGERHKRAKIEIP
ncbi:hypothetical protein EVJ58_g5417 [Rhodofomes roseus]|uniref:Uncharacterized protein n=1 Tax=Rhodofomes roseus TaxID=34475 RepID=A0A4Y9YEW1_9APHY|nr:hypothetical protein EVJ58_g5417 [Rhodofomes roseus]